MSSLTTTKILDRTDSHISDRILNRDTQNNKNKTSSLTTEKINPCDRILSRGNLGFNIGETYVKLGFRCLRTPPLYRLTVLRQAPEVKTLVV
jgi:hypothetical protein